MIIIVCFGTFHVCLPASPQPFISCALPESIFSIALVSLTILTTKGYSFMYSTSLFAFCVCETHACIRQVTGGAPDDKSHEKYNIYWTVSRLFEIKTFPFIHNQMMDYTCIMEIQWSWVPMNVSREPSESSLVETSHCHKGEELWSIIHSSLRHANQRQALQFHSHQELQLTSLSIMQFIIIQYFLS